MVMDRRGFGASPDIAHSDYAIDAEDVLDLLGGGAHLVGHSYGGVVALFAATQRPCAVRSLTLIEPAAHRLAADHPVVATALERMRAGLASAPTAVSAETWLRFSTEAVGLPPLDPTPARLRATRTASRERPCWEADFPLEPVAAAPWPKLIVAGTWETAPLAYRTLAGEASMACAAVLTQRMGARLLRVPGATHWSQNERPDVVNAALRTLWQSAVGRD